MEKIKKEKGLIAYYNVLLVFLFCSIISLSMYEQTVEYNSNNIYSYELIQLNILENYLQDVVIILNDLDEIPSKVNIWDRIVTIKTVDKDNNIYSLISNIKNNLPFKSEYYSFNLTFKFIKGNCKIMNMEISHSG